MTWVKHCLTNDFVSESCCFADVDGDGVFELVAGDSWWRIDGDVTERHRFRVVKPAWLPDWPHDPRSDPFPELRRGGGPPSYQASTYDWASLLSGKKVPDIIAVQMHRDPIVWHENPGDGRGMWRTHTITDGGIYESVIVGDFGPELRSVLLTVPAKGTIAWFEPPSDPRQRWIQHIVGEHGGDWHGLGCGDVDGDGRPEILCKQLIYRQADDVRAPWLPTRLLQLLEDGRCVQGLGDVFIIRLLKAENSPYPALVSASPHGRGIWMWTLCDRTESAFVYRRHTLESKTSQVHSLKVVSVGLEGVNSIICGKRWHAHGPRGDVGADEPPVIMELRADRNSWQYPECEILDSDSGVGIHFDTMLRQGVLIVATANKRGVHVFSRPVEGPSSS